MRLLYVYSCTRVYMIISVHQNGRQTFQISFFKVLDNRNGQRTFVMVLNSRFTQGVLLLHMYFPILVLRCVCVKDVAPILWLALPREFV